MYHSTLGLRVIKKNKNLMLFRHRHCSTICVSSWKESTRTLETVCVCVCVGERESRDREKERDRDRQTDIKRQRETESH